MDPEPSGHRRRRSSLMNPLNQSAKNQKSKKRSGSAKGAKGTVPEDSAVEQLSLEESTSDEVEMGHLPDDGLDDEETGLTGKDKSARKQRRRRNTLLDQRIVGETTVSAEERKEADQNVMKKSLVNGLLIAMWYTFSLSISIVRMSHVESLQL